MVKITSRKFVDRKSAKAFADDNNAKVERYSDPTGYFKFIVRLAEVEPKKESAVDKLTEVREIIKKINQK